MPAVLIVDDDPGTLEGFHWLLRADGYDVTTAATGQDALGRAQPGAFDVMLVDLHLPDMSGVQLLQHLRTRMHSDVPVVMMTGFGTVTSAVQAMKLGAVDYMEKPIVGDVLVNVVRSATAGHHAHNRRRRDAGTPPPQWMPAGSEAVTSMTDSWVARAVDVIERRYGESPLTVRVVAHELGVSHEHLCRLIKRRTGRSFGALLRDTRLREARRLLLETSLRVKEIAAAVGYRQTSHLDRHFRRCFAVSPVVLRRTVRSDSCSHRPPTHWRPNDQRHGEERGVRRARPDAHQPRRTESQ